MDDILCNDICRSCLCTEEARDWCRWLLACLDLKVLTDDVKHVELLSLVLVKSLNLDIKD